MKTKKIAVNLPSLLLGMALCLILVVLVGSKSPAPQVDNANAAAAQAQARARVIGSQKPVTLDMIMDKLELIDQRILIAEGKLNRLQEDMNRVLDDTGNIRRRVGK